MQVSKVLADSRKRALTREETALLLSATGEEAFYNDLFATAFEVRQNEKGKEFILDGFAGPVANCTIDPPCRLCLRSTGATCPAPLGLDEVRVAACYIEKTGTRRMRVSAGTDREKAQTIVDCACAASRASHLRISVNGGSSFTAHDLKQLKGASVDEVSALLVTINPRVFARVKPGDDLHERMKLMREIKAAGLKLASGIIVGLGDRRTDHVIALLWLKEVGVDYLSIIRFNPIPSTPMEETPPASPIEVCKIVAVARLFLRTADISAGGIMNDPRLLPMQVKAGANRATHLGAMVYRESPGMAFRSGPAVEERAADGLVFSNLRPISEGIIRESGLEPD